MVTPEISGLMNGDVLAALSSNGITCSTGDNTWWAKCSNSCKHCALGWMD
jgi:hypothetical protein